MILITVSDHRYLRTELLLSYAYHVTLVTREEASFQGAGAPPDRQH